MNFLLALEIVSQTSPGNPSLHRSVLLMRTWAVITHSSGAGHLPAPSSSLLCRTQALLDLLAQQWEDFPSAVTHSHTDPNVFTESRRLKKENVFRGFPKPELGALTHQPRSEGSCPLQHSGGAHGRSCLAFNPQVRGAFALERLAACGFLFF